MGIMIREPGLLSTVQDQGRNGYQKDGVIVSGAMDSLAARITNMLVGNWFSEAVLEMTLKGAKMEFQHDALIAVGGGDMTPSIDGGLVPMYRPVVVRSRSVLHFGTVQAGCRAYMAIAGGLDVPFVMNSYATYLRAGIGGFKGRSLQKDDVLPIGSLSEKNEAIFAKVDRGEDFSGLVQSVSPELLPHLSRNPTVRAFKGRQYNWFTDDSQEAFFEETFSVTTESDRMGYRLSGAGLTFSENRNLLSEAVANGTIQVSSDGTPIILLADRQTAGGYPKIGQIATVDLPVVAQLKPGDAIMFKKISHDASQALLLERTEALHSLQRKIDESVTGES